MDFRVTLYLFVCVLASARTREAVGEGDALGLEVRASPESSQGGRTSNNRFSTSRNDEEATTTPAIPFDGDGPGTTPVAEDAKADVKKDSPKKKATPRKKDRGPESEPSVEGSGTDAATLAPATDAGEDRGGATRENPSSDADPTTTPYGPEPSGATRSENLSSSDERPPSTTTLRGDATTTPATESPRRDDPATEGVSTASEIVTESPADVLETETASPTVAETTPGGLSNDLDPTTPDSVRRQKQMSGGPGCPCDERTTLDASRECEGARTAVDPDCPCAEVCARQSGQPCSPGLPPCDEEFGLHCSPKNGTCTGQLSIRIFDVSHHSAKVTWGMSESELQPQALVFYAPTYRGVHTSWIKVHDIKPVVTLDNLSHDQNYYVKVEEDGKQEISTFRTKSVHPSTMPKILVKQRSQTSLTVVWDDFRLPSYHSEYVLEYRTVSGPDSNWTKVKAGTQTIVTVSGLTPNTPYEVKVAVWENEKMELPSEVITAYTADGCVRNNRSYGVGEEFFLECDFRCTCNGDNESDCNPRCSDPYVRIGSKTDDPQCYEKVVPSDPCCVTIRCTESKALDDVQQNKSGECPEILEEPDSESCLSDCDHDRDCDGALKCCPSSCGGAVCAHPLQPKDVCEHVYCGPNAECLSAKMACVCSSGFEGDPHDIRTGCSPVNSTSEAPDHKSTTSEVDSGNELAHQDQDDRKESTDAPFELDLTAKVDEGNATKRPALFDGCEFNNATYARGEHFEDGCDALCVCEGRGHLSCAPRCNVLSSGGPACREVPDPDDPCCRIMVCSFPGGDSEHVEALPMKILSVQAQNGTAVRVRLGTSLSRPPAMAGRDAFEVWYRKTSEGDNDLSQWHKEAVRDLSEVRRGVFEFDVGELEPQTDYYIKVGSGGQGLDMTEFSNTVNVKTFPSAVKSSFEGCFHHNRSYGVGESFFAGCEHRCVCRERGFVECQDRCALYVDAVGYEGCEWLQSDEDPCCSVPFCNRRKIPLTIGDTHPGTPHPMCVLDAEESYRVGDIWESADGCRTKICRCTQLPNGTTSVQCQSECPPLPPAAHIPTARCPHPVLVKPDGPCKCPYVSCEEAPPRHVVRVPQCEFKGERYAMGQEFYDGCLAVCHCGQDLRVACAAVECPYHFGADFTNCLEWDIDPDFFPAPPKCCAPAKCKNDGSCLFSGRKFQNFEDIPAELLPCGARCVCVNGNVTCENRCPPVEDTPPANLPCPPSGAHRAHPDGETCCLQWTCKETPEQAHCQFQGSRYSLNEKWEVQKGSQQRSCTCRLGSTGHPEVECRGGCPKIPQRFLLPTEQCLRPVTVNPDDPLICPYVVCNNTISGQELYNVNVVALNSTAVRIRFSLSGLLVGLVGHAELHFTADPALPPAQWHVQKFSRPKRLFDSPNIEYVLNALRPNTTYFLQVKIRIDALQGGPESELFKLRMPEEVIPSTTAVPTTTTTVPPLFEIDARPEAHPVDPRTARVSWRPLEAREKRFVYALQLRYRARPDDQWTTTPMIHRDVTSYFLHDLRPASDYDLEMLFTPPSDTPTRVVSTRATHFRTPGKEEYHLRVSLDEGRLGSDRSAFRLSGIPDPVPKHVHVIKILYRAAGTADPSYSFKVPETDRITLDHLMPGKKYVAQLELYLTNGQTLTSNEVEFVTKQEPRQSENSIGHEAELLQREEEGGGGAYFVALVVVAVVAAVAGFGFVLLLVLLVRRQASAKAPISRTPSESAYDNPTYKTYDVERTEDKSNSQAIQTTQA